MNIENSIKAKPVEFEKCKKKISCNCRTMEGVIILPLEISVPIRTLNVFYYRQCHETLMQFIIRVALHIKINKQDLIY